MCQRREPETLDGADVRCFDDVCGDTNEEILRARLYPYSRTRNHGTTVSQVRRRKHGPQGLYLQSGR